MSNQTHEDQSDVIGTIPASSEFIPESTLIPDSGYVAPVGVTETPEVPEGAAEAGDDADYGIPESTTSPAPELPGTESGSGGASGLKKNLPFIILGGIVVVIGGMFAMKHLGGRAVSQAPVPVAQVAPAPVVEPVAPVQPPVETPPAVASAPVQTPIDAPTPAPAASAVVEVVNVVAPNASAAPVATAPAVKVEPAKPEPATPKAEPATVEPVKKVEPVKVEPMKQAPVKTEPAKTVQVKRSLAVKAVAEKTEQKKVVTTRHPVKTKAKPEPLPSIEGYKVHMTSQGLAWVVTPAGNTLVVKKGDRIADLGVVKTVDVQEGTVAVGRVVLH